MRKTPVVRKTLREQVYDALRAEIISGDVFPGESLTLKRLADQFGVSIVPVREALFQLSAEGVVFQRSNKDYRVGTLTPDEFKETYRIRNLIEPYIAERSFIRRPERAGTELGSILDCMRESVNNPREYIRCNQMFHFTLYSYGNMPVLMSLVSGLWARIGPYLSIHMELLGGLAASYEVHAQILRTFIGGEYCEFIKNLRCDLHEAYVALSPLVKQLDMNGAADSREEIARRVEARKDQRLAAATQIV